MASFGRWSHQTVDTILAWFRHSQAHMPMHIPSRTTIEWTKTVPLIQSYIQQPLSVFVGSPTPPTPVLQEEALSPNFQPLPNAIPTQDGNLFHLFMELFPWMLCVVLGIFLIKSWIARHSAGFHPVPASHVGNFLSPRQRYKSIGLIRARKRTFYWTQLKERYVVSRSRAQPRSLPRLRYRLPRKLRGPNRKLGHYVTHTPYRPGGPPRTSRRHRVGPPEFLEGRQPINRTAPWCFRPSVYVWAILALLLTVLVIDSSGPRYLSYVEDAVSSTLARLQQACDALISGRAPSFGAGYAKVMDTSRRNIHQAHVTVTRIVRLSFDCRDAVIRTAHWCLDTVRSAPDALVAWCKDVFFRFLNAMTNTIYSLTMMVLEWLFGSWCGLLFLLAMIAVGVRVCRRFLDFIDRHPLLLPSLWERRLELCSQLWQVMAANGRLEYLIPLGYFIRSMFNACVIMFFMILILLVYPAMSQAGPKGPWFAYPFIVCAARFNTEVRLLRNDLDKLQGKNETPSVDKDQLERENAHLRAEVDKYRKYATYYEEQWDRTLNNRYAADQNADQESELQRKRFEQELDAQESRYHAKINRFLNTAAEQQSKDEKTIKDQRRGIASLEKEIAEIREELKVPTNCEEHAKVITGYQSQLEMIKGDLDHQTGQLADAFEDASRTKKDSEDERKAWKEAEERLRTKLERAEDKYNLYWRRSKDSENACSRLTRRCERLATDLKSAEKVIEHCPTSSKALSLVKSRNKRLTSCLTNFVDSEERITAAYQEVLAKYNKLLTVHNDYKAPEAEALAEALHKVADLQKSLSTAEEKFEGLCKKTAKLHIELHLLKSSTDPKNSEHTETLAKVQTLEEELRTALNCNSKVCEELEALKAKQSSYDSKEEAVRRSSAKIESLTRRLEQADKLVENLRKGTSVDGASQEGGDTATGKRSPHEKEQPVAEMVKDQAKRKFNASFSNGYDCIKTDSKDCLCGFDAVIKSLEAMRLNDPNLPVPSIKDLMAGWKSEANVERWRDIFGEETPMTENWFAPDEISVALSYWAAAYTKDHGLENKLKLQIGLYKKVSVANQKGTYITPGYEAPKLEHCAFADDPDCKVVWIHHDGLAHYEGMKNRGRQG